MISRSSMRNGIVALFLSLLAHGLVATALAIYLRQATGPDVLVQLDLTSVELSFSEEVEETAAAISAPSQPLSTEKDEKLTRPEREQVPPPVAAELPRPPEAEAPALREPEEPPAKLTSPKSLESSSAPAPAVAVAPRQARVDAPPKPKRNIRPDYPREARRRGEQGDVVLELEVAADGTVSKVRVVQSPGFPLLDEAAVRAVRDARFVPASAGGKSVASTARLTLNFKLK